MGLVNPQETRRVIFRSATPMTTSQGLQTLNFGKVSDSNSTDAQTLLTRIRAGHGEDLGRLFERYRNYIRLVASMGLPDTLQGKIDSSDVVQETFVRANAGFKLFSGTTEREFRQWLQQILATELATQGRRFLTAQKRDVRLELNVRQLVDQTSVQLERALISPDTSPSQMAARRENGVRLADALSELSEEEREVVMLHCLKELPFAEVARRLGISIDRVYGIWARAVRRLKLILEDES